MTTRLVIRLLDAQGGLLGWTEVMGLARGDGCLHLPVCTVPVEIDGEPRTLSVHWCDLNVEARSSLAVGACRRGTPLVLNVPPIVIGPPGRDLPAVTVTQPCAIDVPAGVIGSA